MLNYKPKKKVVTYPRFAGKYTSPGGKSVTASSPMQSQPQPYRRDTPKPPSLNAADAPGSYAPRIDPNKYTGTACLGIAAMHKSNLVPVFTNEQAVDTATMRRN